MKPHDGSRQELRDLDDLQPRPEAQGLEALLRRGLVHAIRHRQPLQLAVLPLQSYRTLECEQERREKGKNQLLRPEFHIISLFFSFFFQEICRCAAFLPASLKSLNGFRGVNVRM